MKYSLRKDIAQYIEAIINEHNITDVVDYLLTSLESDEYDFVNYYEHTLREDDKYIENNKSVLREHVKNWIEENIV